MVSRVNERSCRQSDRVKPWGRTPSSESARRVTLHCESGADADNIPSAPAVEECISYRLPGFRLGREVIVWFAAAANHSAFYPGAFPIQAHKDELDA